MNAIEARRISDSNIDKYLSDNIIKIDAKIKSATDSGLTSVSHETNFNENVNIKIIEHYSRLGYKCDKAYSSFVGSYYITIKW